MTYKAWCITHGATEGDAFEVPGALDAQDAAREAGDYYWSHCDGWEDAWPLIFAVKCAGGEPVEFDVDMEAVPEFLATPRKKEVTT